MQEPRERPQPSEKSPKELYNEILDQVDDIARRFFKDHPTRTFLKSQEESVVVSGADYYSFQFNFSKLNISKTDRPEGAYPTTFMYTFETGEMKLTYVEAIPPREESFEFNMDKYSTAQEFVHAVKPHLEKINLLFEYFGVQEKIRIPIV